MKLEGTMDQRCRAFVTLDELLDFFPSAVSDKQVTHFCIFDYVCCCEMMVA